MEKKTLLSKYEAIKIKHSKLTAVLEDYQIRIGDLNHNLEELKRKRCDGNVRESTNKVLFSAFCTIH